MYQMTDDEFEAAIDEALEGLPPRFLKALETWASPWRTNQTRTS